MPENVQLRDGSNTQDRRLDRIPAFDQRSLAFPVSASLNAEQQTPVSKKWTVPAGTPVLDQGQEGACVGFGITHELLYYPVAVRGLDANFAREKIYWVAQRDDPWPGGSYPEASPRYEGTSVLYGVKAAADLGYYKEYRWATSEKEMCLGVGYLGPAIIGVDWYEGMFRPNDKGYITPSGDKVGGHCTLIVGVNVREGYYTLHNSWGESWGDHGNAKISRKDMAKLMADNGEICIVTQRTLPPPVKKEAARRADAILPDHH
jgi:hypothetical protein